MKVNGRILFFTLLLVIAATACKFFLGPDITWSGFSPVIAIALLAGFIIPKKDFSFILPLLALFLSDVAIQLLYQTGNFEYAGFYGGQWKNYLLILSATLIGWMVKGARYSGLVAGGILAPTVYFLASNFMVWQGTSEAVYSRNFSGLMTCYEAGLPFYKNSMGAMLVFLPLLLFSYNYIVRNRTELKLA
ncbi:MAG: hypothetical protein IPP99_18185 [Chitinophagaceae bacterium]|nr:hypothetical protein [Chitinophagaceae bacterium]